MTEGLRLKGSAAIVTGAGSGINLEFARLLLQNGANVLFADIALRPEAEDLLKQYETTPNRGVFKYTDVTSWADLNGMFDAAIEAFGSIDIICPGAGIFEPHSSNFWYPPGTPESRDDPLGGSYKILDLNLVHPIRVTQLAISHFLNSKPSPDGSGAQRPKSIVHIASVAAQIATIMFPLYCVSKHGVQAFVRCLADLEESHGIRVTAVDPGVVKTPIWIEDPTKNKVLGPDHESVYPDWVTPEEVARVMLACVLGGEIATGVKGEPPIRIRGGSCLEVLAGTVRDVPLFNNPGPFGDLRKGAVVPHPEILVKEILEQLKPGWGQS